MDPRAPGTLADRIDAVLPQTQCGRCGYAACGPYAEAIASGEAAINRCPPGGVPGMQRLARITGLPGQLLDPECGDPTPPQVARIDEDTCIGCTKCIQACPVDAIVGASKLMHTVVADLCTGCELCVAPCPVDCITMLPEPCAAMHLPGRADAARTRFVVRTARQARERHTAAIAAPARDPAEVRRDASVQTISKAGVLAAVARGRAKKISGAR